MKWSTMITFMMDITLPEVSYFIGLAQSDGHNHQGLGRKGSFSIELQSSDGEVLRKIAESLPVHTRVSNRSRVTNFSKGKPYDSTVLRLHDLEFRSFLDSHGVTIGSKSNTISPPTSDHSRLDYMRGIIDVDGSLGFTARGYPFVSLVTASEPLKEEFEALIHEVCGVRRLTQRNKRDNVFNIMVASSSAVSLSNALYYPGCLAIPRKSESARLISEWVAPSSRYGAKRMFWTPEHDEVVRNHTDSEASAILGRTEKSVQIRRYRLAGSKY